MGVFNPLTFLPIPSAAPFSDHQTTHLLNPNTTIPTSSPPPQPLPEFSPFKPSIAIVLGLLTTIFSITFLLLLYAKHCKRNRNSDNSRLGYPPSAAAARINSGIDRAVIESLPIFRFGSLSGDKDGLECSVCLTKFEITEVLRLLPKCKHAFHVECVDTWLDAHSTCPLCRYRVDPEDILLIGDAQILQEISDPVHPIPDPESKFQTQRISGRHSSAGEMQIGKIGNRVEKSRFPGSTRLSLDSFNVKDPDRCRKDGLLLSDGGRKSSDRRLEHRIIVSSGGNRVLPPQQRWSDVQPSDLLHLRSEMIINDSQRRFSWASVRKTGQQQRKREKNEEEGGGGRNAVKTRSVSEIMGLSRLSFSGSGNHHHQQRRERGGVLPRWSDVGSGRTAIGGC